MKATIGWLIGLASLSAACPAQDWLDRGLRLETSNGVLRSDITGLLDLEGYYVDQRAPGLINAQQSFPNPRASFFVDSRCGEYFYSLVQARVDRGFDPATKDVEGRLDEYLLRWIPVKDGRLNAQFGKFATVVGSWVQRHDSWQNPLITAPLPYENLTTVSDGELPMSPGAFLQRRRLPDRKEDWLPVIWGPVYATGWGLFGNLGKMDYAFDLKNAALSSHPYAWELNELKWRYPTVSGRLAWRAQAAWSQGISFSSGPYLSTEARADLRPGQGLADYNQITLASDLNYAWGHWQLWAELFLTRFEIPNVGNADLLTYYVEFKYQITSGLFAAARWNQQLFGSIADEVGKRSTWDNNMLRIDLALGYRFSRHLQSKLQYSFGHREAALQQGEQLAAAQVTLRF